MFKKAAPYILTVFAIAAVIFATTVKDRAPWRGQISDGHHQLITAEVVKFSSNWYAEDPVSLKFALLELPKSVESPTIQDREPYVSYAPGAILPIYLIAKVFHHAPTVYLVHDYNLLNHFLIGLALAAIAFSVARALRLSYGAATVLSIIPLLLCYVLPGPMYFFQNVYFADTAVILPATLFILLEVWRYFKQRVLSDRWLFALQAGLLFYGTLTDWYFVFLALGAYGLRLAWGEYSSIKKFITKSVAFWLPVATALGLFVLQLSSLGGSGDLKQKFFARTSSACKEYPGFTMPKTYWQGHMPESFGRYAVGLLWLSLIVVVAVLGYMVYRRLKRRALSAQLTGLISIMSLLLVVPFVRVYALRCHSVFHDFTTMFFVGAVALVPFVLLPLLLMQTGNLKLSDVRLKLGKYHLTILVLPLILLALAFTYAASEHYRYVGLFPQTSPNYAVYGGFIKDNVSYKDVVVSPDYEAGALPPQQIIYTNKQIHMVESVADILKITQKIQGEYTLKIFVKSDNSDIPQGIVDLIGQSTTSQTVVVDGQRATLYSVPISSLK